MTFHAYRLPKGAPFKMVWFPTCDVCSAVLAPVANTSDKHDRMRAMLDEAGWRYRARIHPLDTCADCLAAERADAGTQQSSS